MASALLSVVVGDALRASAQQTSRAAADSDDLATIAAEAESLRNEQLSVGSQLLENYPDQFDAWRIMGFVHSSQGNPTKMATCWQKCRELQPDRADVHDQLGRYSYQSEDFEAAIESWRRTLEIQPSFPGIRQRIGSALLQLGRAEEARDVLRAAIEVEPRNGQAHLQLGDALFQLGEMEAAKDSYATASELSPTNPKTVYGLMKACGRLGEGDEMRRHAAKFRELQAAAADADRAMRQEFDDLERMRSNVATTLVDAGRFYVNKGIEARAEKLWLRASELNENDASAHELLLTLYEERGDAPNSFRQLVHLARLQPGNAARWQRIGFLSAQLGRMQLAETAFRNAIAVDPTDAAGYRALAKFYLNTKQKGGEAHQLAVKAVQIEPVAESYFVLGWADLTLGKRTSAIEALDRALKMDPNNRNYRVLRQAAESAPK